MLEENRRLSNMKQNTILDINHYPSGKSVPEGDILISHPKGRPLRLYKKLKGMLWWSNFTRDGNEYVDKDLEVDGEIRVDKNLKVDGEIKGTRLVFNFGTAAASSTSFYMKTVNGVGMSSDLGYAMHRPGSIVGVSARFQCTNYTHTEGWSVVVCKNGAEVFNTFPGVSVTSDTSPAYYSTYDTQARGTDTFVAGDLIQVKMNPTIGSRAEIDNVIGYFEVIFDD